MENAVILDLEGLQALIDELDARGFSVLGPVARDGAIVPARIHRVAELPRGWGDEQDAAHYRLRRRDDDLLFGFATGAQSWKPVLFPSQQLIWSGHRDEEDGFSVDEPAATPSPYGNPPYALLGVRSCDLNAIAIHDRVLTERAVTDPHYVAQRESTFIIGVACSDPAGTCFCVSMGTGPRPVRGFDLSLTELVEGTTHRLLVEVGSERGAQVVASLPHTEAVAQDRAAADAVTEQAVQRMGRQLDTTDIRDLLYGAVNSPRWDQVAARCLACGNCTAVCPTCFCTTVEDHVDLTGDIASRERVWDSCFTGEYSYLHGGSVRTSIGSRYRQWATHKLASWIDQFGTSGCVGCGRCVTWCPAAIDLTAEVAVIRNDALESAGES